jgi:hypothetical protein
MSDFYGLPTCLLANDHLRLEYLAEAGPRIVRLFAAGSAENLLAEVPEFHWVTPLGQYHVRGGHRLWHAPESRPRTYVPDDHGLSVHKLEDGVELCQPTESPTGLRKSLTIQLHPGQPAVTLTHRLTNEGVWPIEVSPWAITQLRLDGLIILPQPAPVDGDEALRPNRHLVLWPYARWDDPRLSLGDDFILFQARSGVPACKIGYLNTQGWAAYLRNGTLFVKSFQPQVGAAHPDRNCNVEVYGNDHFVELETVAPMTSLEPRQSAAHVEHWELFTGLDCEPTREGVRALVHQLKPHPAPQFAQEL